MRSYLVAIKLGTLLSEFPSYIPYPYTYDLLGLSLITDQHFIIYRCGSVEGFDFQAHIT